MSDHAAVQRLAREQLLGETRERRPMLREETLRPLVLRRDDALYFAVDRVARLRAVSGRPDSPDTGDRV